MENNAISRGTLIKIKDKNSGLMGALGEIRALYRDTLFVWIKSSLLIKSNGFYCIGAKQVKNAGAEHMKEANQLAGIVTFDNQANPDRQKKDSLLRGHLVTITKGELKGYRGSVISANETFAEVHVHSKCSRYAIPRTDLFVIHNSMEGMRVEQFNNGPTYVSFDEAANRDYVNVQDTDQNGGFATQWGATIAANVTRDFGDQTPVGSLLGAEEVQE